MKINLPKFIYGSIKLICFTVCLFFNSIILTAQQECNLYCTCNGNCTISGTYNNNATFVNQGILEIRGVFNNYDYFENTNNLNNRGSFQNDGLFDNNNYSLNIGTFNNLGTFNNSDIFENTTIFVNQGIIENTGSFTGGGSIYNYRTLGISNSPDTLDLGDNALVFYMNEPEVIPKYLAKIGLTKNDIVKTISSVNFTGELEVVFIEGKIPLPGETFTLMSYDGSSGTFDNLVLPEGYNWSLDYGDTELSLTMNSILPVDLIFFQGNVENDFTVLRWKTNSELNNEYFEVERSVDGVNFEIIGKVSGNGTTIEETKYVFTDRNIVSGDVFYRLRQVDYNGSINYTKTITVKTSRTKHYTVSPNLIDNGYFLIKSRDGNQSIAYLYNQMGEKVKETIFDSEVNLHVDDLKSGLYILVIEGKQTQVEKIIIQ